MQNILERIYSSISLISKSDRLSVSEEGLIGLPCKNWKRILDLQAMYCLIARKSCIYFITLV